MLPTAWCSPGDKQGLVPRLVIAAVYAKIKEPMKLLWTGKLRLNTVHVDDVVGALWHLATTKPVRHHYHGNSSTQAYQSVLTVQHWSSNMGPTCSPSLLVDFL